MYLYILPEATGNYTWETTSFEFNLFLYHSLKLCCSHSCFTCIISTGNIVSLYQIAKKTYNLYSACIWNHLFKYWLIKLLIWKPCCIWLRRQFIYNALLSWFWGTVFVQFCVFGCEIPGRGCDWCMVS